MSNPTSNESGAGSPSAGRVALTVVVWLWVVIPFLYGVWSLLQNVGALF
ncbi:hypothetical protein PHK61_14520 [Actinomycetospora lutea]|nr:hypothetical protein [Actinomycetospora lutea]MDD7939635.1 hypothetical protein [Actinomycetospora lutea]